MVGASRTLVLATRGEGRADGDNVATSPRGPLPWHVDVPRLGKTGVVGVRMFTFLNIVESGGAGTAVLTGSHRLLNNGVAVRLQDVKSQLKREPFFRELCSRDFSERERLFRTTGRRVKGVDLDVVELV